MKKEQRSIHLSIAKRLTRTYMRIFPLFILVLTVTIAIGTFLSRKWIQSQWLVKQYAASRFIQPDVGEIALGEVEELGGSGAIVFGNGQIKALAGKAIFEKEQISKAEWTKFLMQVGDITGKYSYSVAYEEQGDFWLVIRFPVSIRVQICLSYNTECHQFIGALIFYGLLIAFLLLLLFISAWLYGHFSAKAFIRPLRQLCALVKRIARGEYEIQKENAMDRGMTGEFLWLREDIFKLAHQLKVEKEKLEEVEQEKKQMLLDISHDLRNPLATIMGYAEALVNEQGLSQEVQNCYTEVILKNSQRANGLMKDLFEYTRLDHSAFKVDFKEADICEFIRMQMVQFLPEFEAVGMETSFEIPEEEIKVAFDAHLMERALVNLIFNSIRHHGNGKHFELRLIEEQTSIKISIRDDGVGMEEEIASKIFAPFVRGDASRNSQTGGSGLGLAITAKIIEAHKGQIELVTAPNKGCQFIIQLRKV
ncbi:MAG: HAMP domain-containing histidine kinase [Cellulosilyticum sp.]|nr:HAMP domain-containing histidine kinase [Cellulosilyticum sp.]